MSVSNVVPLRTPAAPVPGVDRLKSVATDLVSGLFIRERSTSRRYLYRFSWHGQRCKMDLGLCTEISEQLAVTLVRRYAALVEQGIDPRVKRHTEQDEAVNGPYTFQRAAEAWLENKLPGYKNAKNAAQTANRLRELYPVLGKLPVAAITSDDVARALRPVWTTRYATACAMMGYLNEVFDKAIDDKHRPDGINPAIKTALRKHKLPHLPSRTTRTRHQPAVTWENIPAFWRELAEREGNGADGLRFAMLTAQRAGQILATTLDQFDFVEGTWSFVGDDAEMMKTSCEHRVPLGPVALKLAKERAELIAAMPSNEPVGRRRLFPMSNMAMRRVLQVMGYAGPSVGHGDRATAHGMRSSFSTWYDENIDTVGVYDKNLAEAQLSHTLGRTKLDATYNRGEKLRLRRILMTRWEEYVTSAM